VRQFAPLRIVDLADSREPRVVAGIVREVRWVNTARGKMLLAKLDDKSACIETAFPANLNQAQTALIVEDELLIVQGQCRDDRFSGGLRFNASLVMDLPRARVQFAKHLRIQMPAAPQRQPDIARLLREFPAQRVLQDDGYESSKGVPLLFALNDAHCQGAIRLGQQSRFWPSDAALAAWMLESEGARVELVYREDAV